MTDISITAANVIAGAGAEVKHGTAGETITAGQVVYREAATGKFKLADCDSATAEVRSPYGIALNGASDGQPLAVQRSGLITIGGTLTAGVAYYLSAATPGGIAPVGDITTGDYPSVLGIATTTGILKIAIAESGAVL